MPSLPLSVQILWGASPIVQFVLAAVMIRRRLHREFPMFFAYTIFRSSTSLAALCLYYMHFYTGHLFGYTNLVHETGCIILRFAAIYELFVSVLGAYPVLRDTANSLYRWGVTGLLIVGVGVAVYDKVGPYSTVISDTLNLMDCTVDIIQCGLLLALIVFSKYLRVCWQSFASGIAVGLGVFAAIDLACAAILMQSTHVPPAQKGLLEIQMDLITMAGYLFCVLIWLTYALLPGQVPQIGEKIPEHDLDSWNHELERLLHR